MKKVRTGAARFFTGGLALAALAAGAPASAQAPAAPAAEKPAAPPVPDVVDRLAMLAGEPGGLTAEEVAKRARETSFDVSAKREALAAAEAKVDQASIGYFPKLSLTGRYTRLSSVTYAPMGSLVVAPAAATDTPFIPSLANPLISHPLAFNAPPVDQWLTQASLGIPLSDYVLRISQNYASASASEKAARLDQRAAEIKTALDGRVAYYQWIRAKAQAAVAEQSLEQAKGHLADAKHAFDVGSASKADVLRVESQVASAEMLVERAHNFVDLAEEQIRTAMHEPGSRRLVVGEDLRVDLPAMEGLGPADTLKAEALEKRLEVRALDETVYSLKQSAKVVRAGQLPRLDGFADAVYANPNQRFFPQTDKWDFTWDVGVQLTWTPNDTLTSTAQGHEIDAKTAQLEAQKQQLRDGVRLEVVQSLQALREAEVSIGTSSRGLTAAEESYRVRRELFKNGRATSVELTDAEGELLRARLEAINARVDVRVARARLLHALGRDVDGR